MPDTERTDNNIYIINNSLPEMLCEDIIEFFEEELNINKNKNKILIIPKKK